MATKMKEQEIQSTPAQGPEQQTTAIVVHKDVGDLFKRSINAVGPVRSLTLKRVLTRPLVSMARRKQLAVEAQSDIYLMDLPLKGRSGGIGATRVFDAKELVIVDGGFKEGDEVIVVCHEIMCSALGRAGFASKSAVTDDRGNVTFKDIPGKALKSALIAFISGDIEDGKRYRSISVAELE
jgi:hypothetical protein